MSATERDPDRASATDLDAGADPGAGTRDAGSPRAAAVVVLLAAGAGTRFTGSAHKLLARLPATDDQPATTVFGRSLAHAWAADVGPVCVVSGALGRSELTADSAVQRLVDTASTGGASRAIHFVHNPAWADGQATSVRAGIIASDRLGADVAVVGLADQPGISIGAWTSVAAGAPPIAVATYRGRRGNPVGLWRDVWPLLHSHGDEGARSVMRTHPELVTGVPCSGSPNDIDTLEDLQTWQSN